MFRAGWLLLAALVALGCAPNRRPPATPPPPTAPAEAANTSTSKAPTPAAETSLSPKPASEVEVELDGNATAESQDIELDPALLEDEPPRCPPEMALVLDGICIDRWEARLVELGPETEPWSPFQSLDGADVEVRAVSQPDVTPQAYVSGEDAERACEASGKRLCTATEWETACRGPRRTTYPYGATRKKGVCNDDGRKNHPVAEVTKRLGLPPDRMWYEGMEHPLINQLKNTLRKTGERDGCTNDSGAFDMVGNLHEWIEDPEGTFRGGFYMDTLINGEGCDYATTAHSKKYHDYSTGFRCCMDADAVE